MSERITATARLELARLRALGIGASLVPLESAAARAGRRVVAIRVDSKELMVLGWADGLEPDSNPDLVATAKPLETLTFAACLGVCWHERAEHPWPGVPGDEEQVLRALTSARGIAAGDGYVGRVRKVLASLRESHWLDIRPDAIRLGPRVAAWTENDVAVLRSVFHKLPRDPDYG